MNQEFLDCAEIEKGDFNNILVDEAPISTYVCSKCGLDKFIVGITSSGTQIIKCINCNSMCIILS